MEFQFHLRKIKGLPTTWAGWNTRPDYIFVSIICTIVTVGKGAGFIGDTMCALMGNESRFTCESTSAVAFVWFFTGMCTKVNCASERKRERENYRLGVKKITYTE